MTPTQKEIKEALEKATPGPWEYHESDDGHEIRMGTSVDSPSNCEVQHLIDYDHGLWEEDDTQYAEAEANALLIANAPTWLLHQQELIEQKDSEIKRLSTCPECGGSGINEMCFDPYYALPCACTVDWMSKAMKQSEEIRKLTEGRDKLAEFVRDMIRNGCWNIDGGDLQDKAEKNGFLREESYDPEVHREDFDGEPGDSIYVFAGLLESRIT